VSLGQNNYVTVSDCDRYTQDCRDLCFNKGDHDRCCYNICKCSPRDLLSPDSRRLLEEVCDDVKYRVSVYSKELMNCVYGDI